MGKALKKIAVTLCLCVLLFVFVEALFFGMQKRAFKKQGKNGIYFWGDSQLFQALSTDVLDAEGVAYFSQCQHGAGYYDLMNFVSSVPDGSDCVLAYTVGFYRSRGDRNIGGLSIEAVSALLQSRRRLVYENQMGIREILLNNAQPQAYYFKSNKHLMYENTPNCEKRTEDSIDIGKMKISAANLEIKSELFEQAIEKLKRKKCTIQVMVFSVHPSLAPGSDFANVSRFQLETARSWEQKYKWSSDTLNLSMSLNDAFYDYTHFTGKAAALFTKQFIKKHKRGNAITYVQIAEK